MDILESRVQPDSQEALTNEEHNRTLALELRERLTLVQQGGGERARQRHESRGKLFVRDRIDRLIDPGTPFLELSLAQGDKP